VGLARLVLMLMEPEEPWRLRDRAVRAVVYTMPMHPYIAYLSAGIRILEKIQIHISAHLSNKDTPMVYVL
jgi:hypothetical protein